MKFFPGWAIAIWMVSCGGEVRGDRYVGEWEGTWFAEDRGVVSATVIRAEGGGYRLEVRDADGDVVTWLDGEAGAEGLVFTTADDSPDRYLSKWRALIPKDGSELVGQSFPAREYGGFEMRKSSGDGE